MNMTFESEFQDFKSKFESMLDSMRQIERTMKLKSYEVDERLDKLSEEISKHKNLRDELETKNKSVQLIMKDAEVRAEKIKASETELNQLLEKAKKDHKIMEDDFKILEKQRLDVTESSIKLQKRLDWCGMEERRLKLFELNLNRLAQDKDVLEKLQEISK